MSSQSSQAFLKELDKKLWSAADKLRANLDAAVYKHAVLGLIFLKYVSDSFAMRQREIEAQLRDPKSEYFLDPADFGGPDSPEYPEVIQDELEERDYYTEKNVFWVPALARWKTLQDSAKLPPGTEIEVRNGKTSVYKITSTGKLIDDALDAIEKENPKLKGVLKKTYLHPAPARSGESLQPHRPDRHHPLRARRTACEGHPRPCVRVFPWPVRPRGGQEGRPVFYAEIDRLTNRRMLEPYLGRVYDPAMGSGGFFVQSERFIESRAERDRLLKAARRGSAEALINHGGVSRLSVYGQESNPTTWRLAATNMAIRGIDFNFGKEPANSFTSDQQPRPTR